MKVLIVCSCTSGQISGPFIEEQVTSLQEIGVEFDYFLVTKKGIIGYMMSYFPFIKKIWKSDYDLIHAHFGFSGLLASLQWFKPVVVTFHGSDVYMPVSRFFSKLAYAFSNHSIFVNKNMVQKMNAKRNFSIISCGVNTVIFHPLDRNESRKTLNFEKDKKYILFSAHFEDKNKNYFLAKNAIELVKEKVELIEMKGYSRKEVNLLMNACDALLVTSKSESGPLVVKEAMACKCPIVSTDVGDVREIVGDNKRCFITSFDPKDIAKKIKVVLNSDQKIDDRNRINDLELSMELVAAKVNSIYKLVTERRLN